MNRKYGKLDEGVLIFAPVNLVIDDMQVINADEADYLAAGYLPIEYKPKPDDNEWQAVYTKVDNRILQSWVYQGRVHDHENLEVLNKVLPKSLSGIPAVHTLPTDAKDGDMCLYSPANIIESGKRIYFDWEEFAKPVDGCYEISGQAMFNEYRSFEIYSARGSSFTITIETPDYTMQYYMEFDENGNLMEGAGCFKQNFDGTPEETYYTSIDELPKYIDVPEYDSWVLGYDPIEEAPVPFFYAPYRLMVYRAGEWLDAQELFNADYNAADRIEASHFGSSQLRPNVFYDFGKPEADIVYITELIEGDLGKRNEYMFSFISGETATELTLPSSVRWMNELVVEPNKKYEISIVDNIGLWCAVDLAVTE